MNAVVNTKVICPCDEANNPDPVIYYSGAAEYSSTDLGGSWSLTRTWASNSLVAPNNVNGIGMQDSQRPWLYVSGTEIAVVTTAQQQTWFNSIAGAYTPEAYEPNSLTVNSSDEYVFSDTQGDQFAFYDPFDTSLPANQRGQLKRVEMHGNSGSSGEDVITTNYDINGNLLETTRVGTDGVTESYLYSYYTGSDPNTGLLQSVTYRQQASGGSWQTVRQVDYTYYNGSEAYGNLGDLKTAVIEDASGNQLDTTYYRYYTPGETGGYTNGLRYVFNSDAFSRLSAAVSNPFTATDSQVAPYADDYFEYDSQQRVTKHVIQGFDSGSNTLGTYTYAYSTSSFGATDFNYWKYKTVETRPDGNQNIIYMNGAGESMLSLFNDINDPANPSLNGHEWMTATKYTTAGQVLETATPTAVSGFNESINTLFTLSPTSGLITRYAYYSSTTATDTTAGGVASYLHTTWIKEGDSGTLVTQSNLTYFLHQGGGGTIAPIASETVYPSGTTSYAYTWYPNSTQMQSETVTAPIVTTAQNGPGTLASSTVVYDIAGRPIWSKDAAGYIDYYEYNDATGAVVKSIVDVDTTQTSEFSNLPTGWTTPAGGGLNLVSTNLVDGLGRTVKSTDPNGNITYTVYNDPDHEVRVYRGWNADTLTTTGPIEVTREDDDNSYSETFTMDVAPHTTDGVPDGTEAIANLQTLTRQYTNAAGQVIAIDKYFNLSGLTYSTDGSVLFGTPVLGTQNANFYRTVYGYDIHGQNNRVVDANGTITDKLFDSQGRVTSRFVGTDDSTTDGHSWSPSNASSNSNMVLVASYQYDSNGVGDGNLTQSILYPDSSLSDARVTISDYDWRNRLIATKLGVQSSETDGANRPLMVYTLDNLGEILTTSIYDGDWISMADANNDGIPDALTASALRSQTVYSYDNQGRVYKTQVNSVNQATGAITGSLTSNTWYDLRDQVIKTQSPTGLVVKNSYDGAGRETMTYTTDGGGDSSWSDALTVTGDIVLNQTQFIYDANGNVIETISKDRYAEDALTDTGALGDTLTGPKARVSYRTSYYDAADRDIADVDVGTNGDVPYTRPTTIPSSFNLTLVTSTTYNDAGWMDTVTDPRGIVTKNLYDNLGRIIATIQAYTDGIPTSSTNSIALYSFDGLGNTTSMTAVMPTGTVSQTTQYNYGVTGSTINSNDLAGLVQYPDPTTGDPSTSSSAQVSYTYDALGEVLTKTDQNGTVHTYTYDVLGRQISDQVTTLGAGVDGSIMKITTAYDALGNASLITSYDGSGAVVNQVQRVYNGVDQLAAEYQSQSGAVNLSTTPSVQYVYDLSHGSRLTQLIYPNGRILHYGYDGSTLDNSISRLSYLADDNGSGGMGQHLEEYSYLGLNTIIARKDPETGILMTNEDPGSIPYMLAQTVSFSDADIGSPAHAGSSSYNSSTGVWTVSGSGTGIAGTSDQFNFDSQALNGDSVLIAQVASVSSAPSCLIFVVRPFWSILL